MASAGRILIMPKGDYDTSVTYEALDLVHHNGTAWLAKKSVTGIEPSNANGEHWFKFAVINSQDYLSTDGGVLKGNLGLGDGRGDVYAVEVGTVLASKKDADNYRDIRVGNPEMATQPNDFLKMIDCKDGVVTDYKIFGEHNLPLLKEHLKSSMKITTNPEGKNYIDWTFSVPNSEDICMSANVEFSTDLYVVATNIKDRTETDVTMRFMLNKEYSDYVTLRIEYTL
jgi:hypothetical protein